MPVTEHPAPRAGPPSSDEMFPPLAPRRLSHTPHTSFLPLSTSSRSVGSVQWFSIRRGLHQPWQSSQNPSHPRPTRRQDYRHGQA